MPYVAEGSIDSHSFPKSLVARADTYAELVKQMAKAVEDIRFYTKGVNSSETQESYTEDLIWPAISWSITKVEETT